MKNKIYDCFLFNDELELLKLRLEYMYDYVDYFVIGESSQTFTSKSKALYFNENKPLFSKYAEKIIHLVIPQNISADNAWENEYFQRNYLKTALTSCSEDDVILISDVDEIINRENFELYKLQEPVLIQLNYFYYYFNLKSDLFCQVTLATPYKYIKERTVGNRNTYTEFVSNIASCKEVLTGWHFSYLFGIDTQRYLLKLNSFSHQEYNTSFYKDEKRIQSLLKFGIDLFERPEIRFYYVEPKKALTDLLLDGITKLGLEKKYMFQKPTVFSIRNLIEFKRYMLYIRNRYKIGLKHGQA